MTIEFKKVNKYIITYIVIIQLLYNHNNNTTTIGKTNLNYRENNVLNVKINKIINKIYYTSGELNSQPENYKSKTLSIKLSNTS